MKLTEREIDIFRIKAEEGLTDDAIGRKFGVGRAAISNQTGRACKKLGVRNAAKAICMLQDLGIIDGADARDPKTQLCDREAQTVNLLVANYSTAEIAKKLGISKHTVNVHVSRAMRKFGARSSEHLVSILINTYDR
jgi:DNA-binding CsgD family transcriptional regulator